MRSRPGLFIALGFVFVSAVAHAEDTDSLRRRAGLAFQAHEYAKSAELYVQGQREGDASVATAYNAACAYARAGKRSEALAQLERAVQHGFEQADDLDRDADLLSLHGDARYGVALQRARENADSSPWRSAALETPYRQNIPDAEKLAGLSRFWMEAKINFVNFDKVRGLDWDAAYRDFIPRVLATKDTLGFYRVLMQFCALLKDGHTKVDLPPALLDMSRARPFLRTQRLGDVVAVTAVLDPALEHDGIRAGLVLESIDGVPVPKYVAEHVAPLLTASTSQDFEVREFGYDLLRGQAGSTVSLGFRDASGQRFTRHLVRASASEWKQRVPAEPPFEFKLLKGNVAYITLNTFADDQTADAFEKALPQLQRASALILDIRENDGGNSSVGERILAHLTDHTSVIGRWWTRVYRPAFRAWMEPEGRFEGVDRLTPTLPSLLQPAALLISARTFSAGEDFARAFDAIKRGPLVGEPTGGSTGQPLLIKLPGGGGARICTRHDTYPDGREYVGVGVQPHKRVAITLSDIRAGRDRVVDAARSLLVSGSK